MAKLPRIRLKRVYDPPAADDGKRFLVDRLWPRGFRKDALKTDGWLKEIAPSTALCRWFGHDPARWEEFQLRYFAELRGQGEACRDLLAQARQGNVTFLYAARDTEHNNAVALKRYLEQQSSTKMASTRRTIPLDKPLRKRR
ncbi:MAG: DUF488 domain-containing protein [Acidobacteria bacterium]|nr:DUF488 domain-containing protein [Acidobacteriota bacterium]